MQTEFLIQDLITKVIDNRGKSPIYHDKKTEYPIIEVNSLRGNNAYPIKEKFKKFVDKDTFNNWFRSGHPSKDDLLISTVGSGNIGEVALYNNVGCIAQNIIALEFDENICDKKFMYYLFSSKKYKSLLKSLDIGSAQPSIKVPHILNLKISIPPLNHQKYATDILINLDKKIDLNEKMNMSLDKIGKTIFNSWFGDFDSVTQETKDKSKSVKIPKDYTFKKLGDFIEITKGKSYKSNELKNSSTALVTLKSFKRNGGYRKDGLKEYVGDFKKEQAVKEGDLIVAFTDVTQSADVIGKPAIIINTLKYSKLVASLDVGIIRTKLNSPISKNFIYFLMLTKRYASNSLAYTNGTNVLHLNKKAITDFVFCLPSKYFLEKFDMVSELILKKISTNSHENKILSDLRNSVLPKLISGVSKI